MRSMRYARSATIVAGDSSRRFCHSLEHADQGHHERARCAKTRAGGRIAECVHSSAPRLAPSAHFTAALSRSRLPVEPQAARMVVTSPPCRSRGSRCVRRESRRGRSEAVGVVIDRRGQHACRRALPDRARRPCRRRRTTAAAARARGSSSCRFGFISRSASRRSARSKSSGVPISQKRPGHVGCPASTARFAASKPAARRARATKRPRAARFHSSARERVLAAIHPCGAVEALGSFSMKRTHPSPPRHTRRGRGRWHRVGHAIQRHRADREPRSHRDRARASTGSRRHQRVAVDRPAPVRSTNAAIASASTRRRCPSGVGLDRVRPGSDAHRLNRLRAPRRSSIRPVAAAQDHGARRCRGCAATRAAAPGTACPASGASRLGQIAEARLQPRAQPARRARRPSHAPVQVVQPAADRDSRRARSWFAIISPSRPIRMNWMREQHAGRRPAA